MERDWMGGKGWRGIEGEVKDGEGLNGRGRMEMEWTEGKG